MNLPGPGNAQGADARGRLRAALNEALRRRDTTAVSALRSALSAISNAEAIGPPPPVTGAGGPHIAGAVPGLGAGEAGRRALSAAEVDQIIQAEISERLLAAGDYERSGHPGRAQRLRSEAGVLISATSAGPPQGRLPPA
jgi:hypothetical protein